MPAIDVAILIAGGFVLIMDVQRRVIADGAVALAGGQIVAVDLRELVVCLAERPSASMPRARR